MSGSVDDELATLEAIYGEEYRLISNENQCVFVCEHIRCAR
jgi:hypothetical protein